MLVLCLNTIPLCMFRYFPVLVPLNNAAINVCAAGFYVLKVFFYCSGHFCFNLT